MARAEEEAVADFETVDGCIQPFSGKQKAEKAEALIETVDGTRILYFPHKQYRYRSYPPGESSRYERYMLLRYGCTFHIKGPPPEFYGHLLQRNPLDFPPICPPIINLREKTAAFYRIAGGKTEREAKAAAGSSGVAATGIKADQMTQGSLLKRPRKDLGMSTGSMLLNKPSPALDSSAESAVGTTSEVKGGSFFKHPAADPSATVEFSASLHLSTVNSSHSASRLSGSPFY